MSSVEQDDASDHLNGITGIVKNAQTFQNFDMKNTWAEVGPAATDFRSDVVTTPTPSMLHAITHTSLLDDVFQEDNMTNDLQKHVAGLTGHEDALLVTSGTMGNQLSIRTHLKQPPHSIVADKSSHTMQWEAGGLAFVSGAMAYPVEPSNGHHLTLTDIRTNAVTSKDIHACPTKLICLENTLAGTILPLKTCQEISAWARAQDPAISMHCDGARLWEAVAAEAGSLRDYCACFDSVSLCFSKSLGAPIGSMIVGSFDFIERARHLRKAMGGGLRQSGVISAPARVAVDETFLGGKLAATHLRAKRIAELWLKKGGRLQKECETNMVWFDLDAAGVTTERFVELGVEHGLKMLGGRLVVHYQIGNEAVERLERVMDAVLSEVGDGVRQYGKPTRWKSGIDKKALEKEVEEVMAPGKHYGDAGGEGVGAL